MKFHYYIGMIGMFVLSNVCALEVDQNYDLGYAKGVFKRADKNKDKKITTEDKNQWKKYKKFDKDNNQEVTEEEICTQVEKLFPAYKAKVKRNIIYKKIDNCNLLIDLYYPLKQKYKKAPLFINIHGGGWQSGSKEVGKDPVFSKLLENGVVCASISYRLLKTWRNTDKVIMRDCVVDCHDLLRFIKKHSKELGIDPNKVMVSGGSAGGHLVQMITWSNPDAFPGDKELAKYKLQPVAGISWFGPSDFREQDLFVVPEGVKKEYDPWHWSNRVTKYSGNIYDSKDEKIIAALKEVSPVVYLTKDSAPLLQIHGSIDAVIPVKHAYHLEKIAKKLGAPVEIIIAENAWHGLGNGKSKPSPKELQQMAADYALKHLVGK